MRTSLTKAKIYRAICWLALLGAIGCMGGMETAEGKAFLLGAARTLLCLVVAYGAAYKGEMLT